jgi:two-component system, sensor histidine kinase and response regulator
MMRKRNGARRRWVPRSKKRKKSFRYLTTVEGATGVEALKRRRVNKGLRERKGARLCLSCRPGDVSAMRGDVAESGPIRRELRERVKKQQCLHDLLTMTGDPESRLEEQLNPLAERIREAWQYPEITAVRIEYAGMLFTTLNFEETPWMMSAEDETRQGEKIRLTVACLEERVPGSGGPFLNQERTLAEAVVARLTEISDRRHVAMELEERERILKTIFSQITDAVVLIDPLTNCFFDFNTSAHRALGYTRKEFFRLCLTDIEAVHSAEEIAGSVLNASAGVGVDFETCLLRKGGGPQFVAMTLRPVSLGGKPLISLVWRILTDRRVRQSRKPGRVGNPGMWQ